MWEIINEDGPFYSDNLDGRWHKSGIVKLKVLD